MTSRQLPVMGAPAEHRHALCKVCRAADWRPEETAGMTFGQMQVRPGMAVVDTRGTNVGQVSEVSDEEFVVRCGDQGVLTLGYDSVRALLGDHVVLDTGPDLDRGR
jgi:hypothetical protein